MKKFYKKNKENTLIDVLPFDIKTLLHHSKGNNIDKLENILQKKFYKENICFFKDRRTAISKSLKVLKLDKSDEVIIPSYACIPVKMAVEKICTPKYVDINSNDSNINPEEISKKISPRTKAILVIHTYGKAAEIDSILTIAKKNNLSIIEDLAQGIGGKYNGKNLGSFGDFTILSFALYKDITSFYGGALVSNNPLPKINERHHTDESIRIFYKLFIAKLKELLRENNKKYLKYNIEKYNHKFLPRERDKQIYLDINKRYITNYMAYLLNNQIKELEIRIQKRRNNAQFYIDNLNENMIHGIDPKNHTFYRFTIKVKNRHELYLKGLKEGIQFGETYDFYLKPLPNSLEASKKNLNIPVHWKLNEIDLEQVVFFLNKYGKIVR